MELPITIRKHWLGYVALFLAGVSSVLATVWGFYALAQNPEFDQVLMFSMLIFIVFVIVAITAVALYVYSLSYITLTLEGLQAVNWLSLFAKQNVVAEWSRVQDVAVVTGGVFALVFVYGTLNIQTAGTTQKLRMTMVPKAEYWQSIIQQLSSQATIDNPVDLSTVDQSAAQ